MYYIYHIPQRNKIGVAVDVARRMSEHKWKGFYDIMEVHECIYKVSDREIELQKEYRARFGKYKVDTIPYWKSVKMSSFESRSKGGKISAKNMPYESRLKAARNQPKSVRSANGKKTRKLTMEIAYYIRQQYATGKYSQQRIADCFKVSRAVIQDILNNKSYTTP